MPPSPYLLWVNSKPTKATEEQWIKWYIEEHVPDLVEHGASTRATFYRETYDFPRAAKEKHERQFLAMYQTKFEEPLKSKEYLEIRRTSEILPGKQITGAGEFNARNYALIQDYDPDNVGEGTLSIESVFVHVQLTTSSSSTAIYRHGGNGSER